MLEIDSITFKRAVDGGQGCLNEPTISKSLVVFIQEQGRIVMGKLD
jgi:hypothetical protein